VLLVNRWQPHVPGGQIAHGIEDLLRCRSLIEDAHEANRIRIVLVLIGIKDDPDGIPTTQHLHHLEVTSKLRLPVIIGGAHDGMANVCHDQLRREASSAALCSWAAAHNPKLVIPLPHRGRPTIEEHERSRVKAESVVITRPVD
jgi:hypothetical protein